MPAKMAARWAIDGIARRVLSGALTEPVEKQKPWIISGAFCSVFKLA